MNPGKAGNGGRFNFPAPLPLFLPHRTEVPSVPSTNMHVFDFCSVITNTGKRLSSDLKHYQH